MSVQAMSWVIQQSQAKLGDFIVLLMIANHANADGTGAWPSVGTLAKEARLSEREIRYCLRNLEKLGELATVLNGGPKGANSYAINMKQAKLSVPGANFAGGKLGQKGGQSSAPEPSLTVLSIPSWVPLTEWNEYCEMRRKFRNVPFTEAAKRRSLDDLAKYIEQGQDPAKMLAQSVQRGWRGIFPVKDGGFDNGRTTESFEERRNRTSAAAINKVESRLERVPSRVRPALPPTDR